MTIKQLKEKMRGILEDNKHETLFGSEVSNEIRDATIQDYRLVIEPELDSLIDQAVASERERIRKFLSDSSVWDNEYIYQRKALLLQKFDDLYLTNLNQPLVGNNI